MHTHQFLMLLLLGMLVCEILTNQNQEPKANGTVAHKKTPFNELLPTNQQVSTVAPVVNDYYITTTPAKELLKKNLGDAIYAYCEGVYKDKAKRPPNDYITNIWEPRGNRGVWMNFLEGQLSTKIHNYCLEEFDVAEKDKAKKEFDEAEKPLKKKKPRRI
jgi:hypothetical protein